MSNNIEMATAIQLYLLFKKRKTVLLVPAILALFDRSAAAAPQKEAEAAKVSWNRAGNNESRTPPLRSDKNFSLKEVNCFRRPKGRRTW